MNNPDSTILIPLTQGQHTIIDTVDADLAQFKWSAKKEHRHYYAKSGGGRTYKNMARIILSRKVGRPLEKREYCDHRDGNTLNNRRENLRIATNKENVRNSAKSRRNTSGYKGVSLYKHTGKWGAFIMIDGKKKYLGTFDTPELAHQAYCEAAKKYHGEFARFD